MESGEGIRIDKYLWAVRICKTRSIAAEECRKGRIMINNLPVKPSHTISANEIFTVRKPPALYTYKVLSPTGNRVSAKIVDQYLADLTPEEEKIKITLSRSSVSGVRPRGLGRPTKKERRSLDRLTGNSSDF